MLFLLYTCYTLIMRRSLFSLLTAVSINFVSIDEVLTVILLYIGVRIPFT